MAPKKAAMAAIVPKGYSGMTLHRHHRQKKRHIAHSIHGHPVAFADTVYSPSEVAITVPTYSGVVISVNTMERLCHSATDELLGS